MVVIDASKPLGVINAVVSALTARFMGIVRAPAS
jgi:hypothetical protein